ncbi:MAG: glycosyltransferase family 4 protein [Tepidisphaeraceae bacterium]
MPRILVITTNLKQASFRLRVDALRPLLAQRSFDLDVQVRPRGLLDRRRLLKSAVRYHAVLLQRKLLDPTDARLLRRAARRIFYDIDDAVMYHAHRVGWFSQWRTNRRFEATTRILDHVVCGNEYLAAMFRQRGRSVTVLPTCVDPDRYRVKELAAPTELVSLVWIGSHSTLPYLAEQMPAIREAAKRTPIKLVVIADRAIDDAGVPLEHVSWSVETESESLSRGDIGIAPTPDDRWTRGKCGFKIIQYMAAGLPVIASPIGANAEIVRVNETGLLATTPMEWTDAIVRLAGDAELRQRMGRAGRERAEREYSLTRAADVWADLLAH